MSSHKKTHLLPGQPKSTICLLKTYATWTNSLCILGWPHFCAIKMQAFCSFLIIFPVFYTVLSKYTLFFWFADILFLMSSLNAFPHLESMVVFPSFAYVCVKIFIFIKK